jgi:hypothetical protein
MAMTVYSAPKTCCYQPLAGALVHVSIAGAICEYCIDENRTLTVVIVGNVPVVVDGVRRVQLIMHVTS